MTLFLQQEGGKVTYRSYLDLHPRWSWRASLCLGCLWSLSPWWHPDLGTWWTPSLRQQQKPQLCSPPRGSGSPPSHAPPLQNPQSQLTSRFLQDKVCECAKRALKYSWQVYYRALAGIEFRCWIRRKGLTVVILRTPLFSSYLFGFAGCCTLEYNTITQSD